jgi:hypothetical protein
MLLAFVLVSALPSMGASYRSDNFAVEAPTKAVAKQVAQSAEEYRQQIAAQWLGKRSLAWTDLCTIDVQLDDQRKFGASRFSLGSDDQLSRAHISVRGRLNEILTRVLPHEVTHTVLMLHFGRPIPRWADEGAAVLAEDAVKRQEYERLMLRIAARSGHAYSLAYLFGSREYPAELDVFYPQSYAVTNYLVGLRGRQTFLSFLTCGMDNDWDSAVKRHYGFKDVDTLERAFFQHLRAVRARVQLRDFVDEHLAIDVSSRLWPARSWQTLTQLTPISPPQSEVVAMPN